LTNRRSLRSNSSPLHPISEPAARLSADGSYRLRKKHQFLNHILAEWTVSFLKTVVVFYDG
jgi:hypothetical protein